MNPGVKIRGVGPIPSGYVVGRTDPGTGDTHLISIADLAHAAQGTGAMANGGGLPSLPSGDLLGNSTAGSATAADTTLTALIDRALAGTAQGNILYRNATAWVVLAPGTSGNFLKTQGAAANPTWAAVTGLSAIADADLLANISGGSAVPTATAITDFLDYTIGNTKGDILFRDTSVWKKLGVGSAGQVLTVSSGVPAWGAAGAGSGGAMSLISTLTASASASLSWTGLTAGTTWRIIGRLMVPATNNTGLGLQFGTGAGPTYITTGYNFGFGVRSSGNSSGDFGAENQAVAPCDNGTVANSAPGTSFDLTITTDNAAFIMVSGTCIFRGQSSHYLGEYVGCEVPTGGPITAMKLAFGTGNITSGNVSLYSVSV